MTRTSTPTNQTQQTERPRPADCLLYLTVNLIAPMFLSVTGGNLDMARAAAAAALNDHGPQNPADALGFAQIIAFGLAALGSLSVSMADDIPVAMALRLRASANACNRSGEQIRRAMSRTRAGTTQQAELPPEPEPAATPVDAFAAAAAQGHHLQPGQPPQAADKRHREMWAIAYTKEAGDIEASLPHLPPAEREQALLRAGTLRSTANYLLTGVASNPRPAAPRA